MSFPAGILSMNSSRAFRAFPMVILAVCCGLEGLELGRLVDSPHLHCFYTCGGFLLTVRRIQTQRIEGFLVFFIVTHDA